MVAASRSSALVPIFFLWWGSCSLWWNKKLNCLLIFFGCALLSWFTFVSNIPSTSACFWLSCSCSKARSTVEALFGSPQQFQHRSLSAQHISKHRTRSSGSTNLPLRSIHTQMMTNKVKANLIAYMHIFNIQKKKNKIRYAEKTSKMSLINNIKERKKNFFFFKRWLKKKIKKMAFVLHA